MSERDLNPADRTFNPPVAVKAAILLTGVVMSIAIGLIGLGPMVEEKKKSAVAASTKGGAGAAPAATAERAVYSLASNPLYRHNPASLVAEGEQSYAVYCASCHQAEGHGKVGFAPDIRNRSFLALASDDFLYRTLVAGRPGTAMTPWVHLGRQKLDGIIAFLRSGENEGAPVAPLVVDHAATHQGNAAEGAGLYRTYCASCHGERGTGYAEGGSGPGIGLQGFLAAASDAYIFHTVKYGRTGSPMRSFMGPGGLANLSPGEVNDIIAHLRSGELGKAAPAMVAKAPDPARGEMHFTANCMACHQQGGTGMTGFAPSIRNRDFLAIASDTFIRETVRKGRLGTAMVPRPDLSDGVIDDIIAYLRSLEGADASRIAMDSGKNLARAGDAAAGQGKFASFCASCHGDKGTGYVAGGSGPGIGLAGFLSTASDDYIFHTLKLGRIGTAMRPFLGAQGLANLSEQDAFDIIAYLRSLQFETASN